jgi:PEP-CTERM motif
MPLHARAPKLLLFHLLPLMGWALPISAHADPLPLADAQYLAYVFNPRALNATIPPFTNTPEDATAGDISTIDGEYAATASTSPTPIPAVSVGSVASACCGSATAPFQLAIATIDYYFEISGPTSSEIPLTISYDMAASENSDGALFGAGSDASLTLSYYVSDLYFNLGADTLLLSDSVSSGQIGTFGNPDFSHCSIGSGTTGTSSQTRAFQASTNYLYEVQIRTCLSTDSLGSISAYVDPMISFAPGFINSANYSIAFSPGIGNAPAQVPEPATYSLLSVALLAFWLVGRRGHPSGAGLRGYAQGRKVHPLVRRIVTTIPTRRTPLWFSIAVICLLANSPRAFAVPLPDAQLFAGDATGNYGDDTVDTTSVPAIAQYFYPLDITQSATATAIGSGVSASAIGNTESGASLNYSVEITGPNTNGVPLVVQDAIGVSLTQMRPPQLAHFRFRHPAP